MHRLGRDWTTILTVVITGNSTVAGTAEIDPCRRRCGFARDILIEPHPTAPSEVWRAQKTAAIRRAGCLIYGGVIWMSSRNMTPDQESLVVTGN
jgi:hypothetical protein